MSNGGLQMTDIERQINAVNIKWVSQMLDVNNNGVWNKIVKYLLKQLGDLPCLLKLNCKSTDVNKKFQSTVIL